MPEGRWCILDTGGTKTRKQSLRGNEKKQGRGQGQGRGVMSFWAEEEAEVHFLAFERGLESEKERQREKKS